MRKGNYDCIVLKLKRHNVKEKAKYELMGFTIFSGLTKELACYYVYKNSYVYTGIKHSEPCKFSESDSIVGYNYCGNDFTFSVAQKHYTSRDRDKNPICIFPEVKHYGVTFERTQKDRVRYFIELLEKQDEGEDLSIECSNIWAPENLIPKGYEHIKEGKVMDGDYYWESYYTNKVDCWQNANVSFSRYKVGSEIKVSGVCYKNGKSGNESEDEVVNWFEPFIIRKKK